MSIFNSLGSAAPQIPTNVIQGLIQRFQQFQQAFRGDPRQKVQELLNSGKINQQQYNQAVQMAQQMQRMIGGK